MLLSVVYFSIDRPDVHAAERGRWLQVYWPCYGSFLQIPRTLSSETENPGRSQHEP